MTSLVDSLTAAGEYRSPGFSIVSRLVEARPDSSILDLGPASGSNVGYFSELGCRLHVADLYRSLNQENGRPAGETLGFARACREMLPDPEGGAFDFILAWDLLNYLTEDEIRVLARHLTALCRPGSELFALISIRHRIPSQPLRYQILEGGRLSYSEPSPHQRTSPEYKEPLLKRLLPGFAVERCFLLRHGFQEYLFRYQPESVASGSP